MNTLTTCSVVSFSLLSRWHGSGGSGGGGINLLASELLSLRSDDGRHVIVLFCGTTGDINGSCLLELLPFGWFVDVGLIGLFPFDDAGYDWLCELSPSATLVPVIEVDKSDDFAMQEYYYLVKRQILCPYPVLWKPDQYLLLLILAL